MRDAAGLFSMMPNEGPGLERVDRHQRAVGSRAVSVIVPVFNSEASLRRTVGSLLDQTHRELEILLVDDGSTDGSGCICDDLAATDPRVQVLHLENGGAARARQQGLHVAREQLVTFVDSDDTVDPRMIEVLVGALAESDADVALCRHRELRADGRMVVQQHPDVPGVISGEGALRQLLLGQWMGLWGKVIRREVLDLVDWPDLRVADDLVVNAQLFGASERVAVVGEPLYTYVETDTGLTRKPLSFEKFQWIDAVERVAGLVAQQHPDLGDEAFAQAFCARFSLLHRALLLGPNAFPYQVEALQRQLRKDFWAARRNPYIPLTKKTATGLAGILGRSYPLVVRASRPLAERLRRA